ncbi:MAG TPA: six-cysteine peptide SCIFF [Thermoanaerobacterales bacterium]|nr:six-cysteine ranthipeptide SCIFF [Tepidanaerobacter sp. GT38]MCG1012933.1 six-cysteine ranthipeptide SCIFF [Tepidanaerobacter sp. GT38]HHY41979.1 six-cysteine peptide SCIFF [Thermoanaerobacterales bacterium]
MKHIVPIHKGSLNKDDLNVKGCGECQSSCQSACKTSCTVANQVCSKEK